MKKDTDRGVQTADVHLNFWPNVEQEVRSRVVHNLLILLQSVKNHVTVKEQICFTNYEHFSTRDII